jgi:apolipoprotein N-acyltransferase
VSGLVAFAAGAVLPAAFSPFGFWPLAIISPALLFFLWREATPKRAALLGFVFGLGVYTTGTYWLYTSIHGFGQAPVWLALILMAGLVILMASYHALLGWWVTRFWPQSTAIRALLVLPLSWVVLEWVRGWFLSGFGWLSIGYSQTDTWLAGFAPIGGMPLISLIVIMMAAAISWLIQQQFADFKRTFFASGSNLIALVVLVMPWILGAGLVGMEWTESQGQGRDIAVVQGAIPQDQKWLLENRETTLDLYRSLTRQTLDADIVVWPEAAIPDLANYVADYLREVGEEAREAGTALAMGLIRSEPGEVTDPLSPVEPAPRYFNSILAWDESIQWYDKHHLVPFGEFFPVPAAVRQWMRLMNLPYADFTRGAASQTPLVLAGIRFAASICYEDAYATGSHRMVRASAALINVTNDAWFGRSTARYQHLQIARMRSIETRRFQVRAANDGVSAVIDPQGRLLATAPEYQSAVLRARIEARSGLTPYLRWGNVPLLGGSLLGLAWALWRRRRVAMAQRFAPDN